MSHACQREVTDSRDQGKVDLGSLCCLYWQFVSLHGMPVPVLIPVGCRIIIVSFHKRYLSLFANLLTGILQCSPMLYAKRLEITIPEV